jgi:hypothetical protein
MATKIWQYFSGIFRSRDFNHSHALVSIERVKSFGPKPFKFFNFWANHRLFFDWVEGWRISINGYSMFQLYTKLNAVKKILKAKNLECFGSLGQRVHQARQDLAVAQAMFIASHGNAECQRKERECLHAYFSLSVAKENFLKQKSRNIWLNLGNGNNAFFHKSIKVRNSFNLIKILKDEEGNKVEDMNQIKELAIGFYQRRLGTSVHSFEPLKADRVSQLINKKFSPSCVASMEAVVTPEEIKNVIFAMNKHKAPGPDGFSAGFYQKAWTIVGQDVSDAVLEFF